MRDRDLMLILRQLSARLERLEKQLGIDQQAQAAAPPPPPRAAAPPPAPPPPLRAAVPEAPRAAPPTVPPRVVPPRAAPVPPPAPPKRPPAAAPRPPRRAPIEVLIGQSWMAWVGAIVIIIGAGFLVKLGYEAGWWTGLPASVRCILVAAFGAALVVGGEVAKRRVGVAASVGLFGAGLGTLYLDAYAAFRWFDVVSQETAFILTAIVAVIGFAITIRTGFRTIGVLSIAGGYLTPWLFRSDTTHAIEVGAYLTMLLSVSLVLSGLRPQSFRTLRYVALGGQGMTGLGWALATYSANWVAVLTFVCAWWGFVLGELLWAAIRNQSPIGNVVASLLSTAWFVTLGAWVLDATQPPGFDWLGAFTASAAVVCAAVAVMYGPPPADLRRPQKAMGKFAVALWAQFGVLAAVAVALQFDGYGESIGWLVIGLASVEISRRLGLRAVEFFGLIVGALAVGRVAALDSWSPVMQTRLFSFGEVTVTNWAVLAVVTIVAVHLAALRLAPPRRAMPVLLCLLGTGGWLALCAIQARGLWMTGGWLLGGAVLIALARIGRRERSLEIGLLAVIAAAGKWLLVDAMLRRLSPGFDPSASVPVLNAQMGMAAAIAAVGFWASHQLVRRGRSADDRALLSIGSQVAIIAGGVLLLVGFSFELDRVIEAAQARRGAGAAGLDQLRQLLLTMLWSIGAVAMAMLVRVFNGTAARRGPSLLAGFAWFLLAACAVKWVLGDTLHWATALRATWMQGGWPVLNAQLLCGLLLAVSFHVMRLATRAEGDRDVLGTGGAAVSSAAALLVLWGLSFEVDRAIGRFEAGRPAEWVPVWDPIHLRALWITLLWAAGGAAIMGWTRRRPSAPLQVTGGAVLAAAAVFWLSFDTVGWRLTEGVTNAAVLFNVQFLVGAAVAGLIAIVTWLWTRRPQEAGSGGVSTELAGRIGPALIALIGLWLGSLEIDRYFMPEPGRSAAGAAMAKQGFLSVYWAIYAFGLITLGFFKRVAMARYAGMALFALTLAKVFTVDLAGVSNVYKVLSFLGLGLLLIATSIGYAKLAPRLLKS